MAKKTGREERGTTSVSVRLPNDLLEWIDNRAADEHRSRANLIKMLLQEAKEK